MPEPSSLFDTLLAMETFTQKWAIIALLENAEEGSEFYYTDFPMHLTLAGVFAVDKSAKQLANELANVLAGQQQIEIEADEKAMFGPNKDIEVMKVKKDPDLMQLYQLIYEWLQDSGVRYNSPEYQGEGYAPHSTFQKTGSLSQGEKRMLQSVSLIDLYPNRDGYQRKIFKTIALT